MLRRGKYYNSLGVFNRTMPSKDLPVEVDWRSTGADAGVKDQGMCGSCGGEGQGEALPPLYLNPRTPNPRLGGGAGRGSTTRHPHVPYGPHAS